MEYGKAMEEEALQVYIDYQLKNGHPNLCVVPSGFIISTTHSFLGASPDGAVYDPDCVLEPFGPKELTPLQLLSSPIFGVL